MTELDARRPDDKKKEEKAVPPESNASGTVTITPVAP